MNQNTPAGWKDAHELYQTNDQSFGEWRVELINGYLRSIVRVVRVQTKKKQTKKLRTKSKWIHTKFHKVKLHELVSISLFSVALGFNPRWDCTFNFTVHVPDLALVRFMVEDHDYTSSNDFLGQYTLPFASLRSGEWRDSAVWLFQRVHTIFALLTFCPVSLQVTVMSDCLSRMAPDFLPPQSSSMWRSLRVRTAPRNHQLHQRPGHQPSVQPRNSNPVSAPLYHEAQRPVGKIPRPIWARQRKICSLIHRITKVITL